MKNKPLSIIPYYGGKSKMAKFIAERLDYGDSDIYIEPFGGACRVLLNKPPHKLEIYNDYDDGLVAIMEILSDSDKSKEFICRLDETDYSQEQFEWAREIYSYSNSSLRDYSQRRFLNAARSFLLYYNMIDESDSIATVKSILKNDKLWEVIYNKYKEDNSENKKALLKDFKEALEGLGLVEKIELEHGNIERMRDRDIKPPSDMDLAIATYIVYSQSRDAMGKYWNSAKYKSTYDYRNGIGKIYECAERLEGVKIYNIDAMDFFRWFVGINRSGNIEKDIKNQDNEHTIMLRWIHDPKVMMYCDPSYIKPSEEDKLLEDIDWQNTDCLSDAINEKIVNKKIEKEKEKRAKEKKPQYTPIEESNRRDEIRRSIELGGDLGKEVYAKSFDYREQENFLRCICDANCKVMVSNYDLKLYNKYLTEENGWKRIEFETFTSVGCKKDNKRVEVLWYNY